MVRILGLATLLTAATGWAGDLPTGMGETDAAPSEVDRILALNPKLVDRLLHRAAVDEDEQALITLYCLGPSVTNRLLDKIESEDERIRGAAIAALTYVCAYEEGVPRPLIVKTLLEAGTKEEPVEGVDEVLMYVVRSTRPEFRAAMRLAIAAELSDEFAGQPGPLRAVAASRPTDSEPQGGLPFLYDESVEDGERVVRVSWPVPFEVREPAGTARVSPEFLQRGPADFLRDLPDSSTSDPQ